MTEETIFSRILNGEIPCDQIYSDSSCIGFKDIQPQAPVHILIIPRKKISSLREVQDEDKELLGHLLLVSAQIAKKEGLSNWRTVINTGEKAGQTVFHLHIHIIGGRELNWPPG
ncbi:MULTISPECIES: histidine triad nucleotide-binding protein [unclassified Prochlorococcus]|uniref:histidine triad nucleotide-binding protein n=1 Tax=unclassified Prochlorococcus TaxID=2627481 RepID=UPI000533A7B7|nr:MULTISPECIES: histidine triad nucleotide-binding protein [unclassified Prochlorococcus]KGG16874.1 Bis(5'-nucleosyl)-tetraphosphatasee (asymmetrical) [Prochlorococcus sp. MIT 0602]KGG18152.1 Bis(5'-nucleosyl)-tetraphosphatasee (asymmetrical) [Prochlorococcus sp. MIT 0603]